MNTGSFGWGVGNEKGLDFLFTSLYTLGIGLLFGGWRKWDGMYGMPLWLKGTLARSLLLRS